VAKKKKRKYIFVVFMLFIVYFFLAARTVPRETILVSGWISPLGSGDSVVFNRNLHVPEHLFPFTLGSRFGYVDSAGKFAINKIIDNNIYLGEKMWTEFTAEPSRIEINNVSGEPAIKIDNVKGYPVLLDNRIFILGSEQNSLSEIGADGNLLWTYEFGAPITCIDAAAGLVLTGSLDGMIEILDQNGKRIYYFEPGGSRYSIIYGCAISRNGSRLGIICGIDFQRFLLLERLENNNGGDYRIIYHEFLESGFRRPVYISFIDEDRRVVFERVGGIGCYNIKSRSSLYIPLDGKITAIDNSRDQGLFFLITSHAQQNNRLIGIKLPYDKSYSFLRTTAQDAVFISAHFKSGDVYLGRTGSMLVAGGGTTLISFNLEER
jgi:hypothetical protein